MTFSTDRDIGMNREFKVTLTPKDDKAVHSQSLPMPIHLREDLIVELALKHIFRIIAELLFSKHASPIFAKRKPNGKLRLLVDLRKMNSLIADDYSKNNHTVSTLSDAAQNLAGQSLFCELDCSQAYHYLQTADQRSVEMLPFNFASRTFAYKRLAQDLSRSVSAFSSLKREYLDPVAKTDQCAQYVDDIEITANQAMDRSRNVRAVFKCFHQQHWKWPSRSSNSESENLNSYEEQSRRNELHRKPGKSSIFLRNLEPRVEKSITALPWNSSTITEIIFPEWLKNLIHSTTCSKLKCQLTLRQNWE